VTNGLAEGVNKEISLLCHRAFGFHSVAPLTATINLCCGGITLPELQLLWRMRFLAWLNGFRRLGVRHERHALLDRAFTHVACALGSMTAS
jgi:hypothetical protein